MVGLKLGIEYKLNIDLFCFNRTMVGLKLYKRIGSILGKSFNRTMVGLKLSNIDLSLSKSLVRSEGGR